MGPVLTIAFGIALGFLLLFLILWLIGVIAYLLFGDSVSSFSANSLNSTLDMFKQPTLSS